MDSVLSSDLAPVVVAANDLLTWRAIWLPLPPTTANHAHGVGPKGIYVTREVREWRQKAQLLVGGFQAPRRMPLAVHIELRLPRAILWRVDAENYVKLLLDLVVGSSRDQWVQRLSAEKVAGDGTATVWIGWVPSDWPMVERVLTGEGR